MIVSINDFKHIRIFKNSIEEALEKDEEELISYVVRNTDYTEFDSYEEFEEYRACHSLDDAIEKMTAFDDKDHMVRRGRKDFAYDNYSPNLTSISPRF